MNIDIHSHFVLQALLEDLAARRHSFPSVLATGKAKALGMQCCGLPPADQAAILGGTAASLFGVS